MAKEPQSSSGVDEQPMRIGPDLWIRWVDLASLKEQDVNAQQMQPRKMDRLTENIRIRGQLESLPYCSQPDGVGPVSIVSGHHRARAARAAGLTRIPVIVDEQPMSQSRLTAKQIAHNELVGEPDKDVLAQLVASLKSVDDMLMTGLDENWLPTVERDTTPLLTPHADFDWRMVALMFLPEQVERLDELVAVCNNAEMVGAAMMQQFSQFSRALVEFGRTRNIKNMAVAVDVLTRIALREIRDAEERRASDVERD